MLQGAGQGLVGFRGQDVPLPSHTNCSSPLPHSRDMMQVGQEASDCLCVRPGLSVQSGSTYPGGQREMKPFVRGLESTEDPPRA